VVDESIAAMTDLFPLPVSTLWICWRSHRTPGRRNRFRRRIRTTPITPSVEEFSSDSVVSVFANGCAYIGAVSISCISIVGHFEISKMSNSVRTAWPKLTKLSGIIALGHPTSHARTGTPSASGSAARGRQILIFDRDYLRKV